METIVLFCALLVALGGWLLSIYINTLFCLQLPVGFGQRVTRTGERKRWKRDWGVYSPAFLPAGLQWEVSVPLLRPQLLACGPLHVPTGAPHFIALHFIALCRCCFKKKKIWRFGAALNPANLSVLFYQQHLLTWCLWVTFGNSHNISDFFIIFIFVMVTYDQWSLVLLLQLFWSHKLHPYKMTNLIDKCCVCSDCSTHWPVVPPNLYLSPASLFPETQHSIPYWN